MWAVLTCLKTEHDLKLVVVAAIVCVVTVFAAMRVQKRLRGMSDGTFWLWAPISGLCFGAGVWATHFIAMVAFDENLPIHYGEALSLVSLGIAVTGVSAGAIIGARAKTAWACLLGGAVQGASILAMHFVGVLSVRTSLMIGWSSPYVASAIAIGLIAGVGATIANRKLKGLAGWTIPSAIMILGILGLHFTAMTAVQVSPDMVTTFDDSMSREVLATMAAIIGLMSVVGSIFLFLSETLGHASSLKAIDAGFRSVPAGLAMFDADGGLEVWNDAYAQMMEPYGAKLKVGLTRDEIVKALLVRGDTGLSESSRETWMAAEKNRESSDYPEWELPDGTWRRAQIAPADNGRSVTILTDITDQKKAADRLAEALARAEAASQAKSDFLANMSHEIRTPLNGVLGMAQVMAADELSPRQRERLEIIKDSGVALNTVLNDILDLSRVQAGKLILADEPFDAVSLANDIVAAFHGAAEAKGLSLEATIDGDCPAGWRGDALRIRQVLSNLVGNALKFTDKGDVRLRVVEEAGRLVFRVSDTGIGMEADQIPGLFEKFSQADATATRRYGGTGLGLAICQELVGLMGGAISAVSTPGAGSCFTVSLPLARAEVDLGVRRVEPDQSIEAEAGLAVLVAEDNPTNQKVIRSMLEPLGADVTVVDNGQAAVEAFRSGDFEIILMDIQMPVMNGVEAVRAIRRLESAAGAPRTPIVAVTANVMTHQVEAYRAAGMDGCVAKPITLPALVGAIEAALEGQNDGQAAESAA